ncbi:hypothetical protein MRB53_027271 [Persea americana]|uniref:Uncharacterized protein n=1 Tax=Persea americana TaxID=3435 RepID=A0ACC2LKX2_PERAE|nr:hypothetical protein MRB53_027271 [Persea americana]
MPRKVVSDVLDSSPQQMAGNEKDRDLPCLLPFQLKEALHRRLLRPDGGIGLALGKNPKKEPKFPDLVFVDRTCFFVELEP